jgi:hypothetical protein
MNGAGSASPGEVWRILGDEEQKRQQYEAIQRYEAWRRRREREREEKERTSSSGGTRYDPTGESWKGKGV